MQVIKVPTRKKSLFFNHLTEQFWALKYLKMLVMNRSLASVCILQSVTQKKYMNPLVSAKWLPEDLSEIRVRAYNMNLLFVMNCSDMVSMPVNDYPVFLYKHLQGNIFYWLMNDSS